MLDEARLNRETVRPLKPREQEEISRFCRIGFADLFSNDSRTP